MPPLLLLLLEEDQVLWGRGAGMAEYVADVSEPAVLSLLLCFGVWAELGKGLFSQWPDIIGIQSHCVLFSFVPVSW